MIKKRMVDTQIIKILSLTKNQLKVVFIGFIGSQIQSLN